MSTIPPEITTAELPAEGMALEQFLKDLVAAGELREFLGSETGRKFRGVLAGMDPMKGLCEVRTLRADSVRVLAKVEESSAPSILAFCRGYGVAVALIEAMRQPPVVKADPPQSRKAGRGTIPPHQS